MSDLNLNVPVTDARNFTFHRSTNAADTAIGGYSREEVLASKQAILQQEVLGAGIRLSASNRPGGGINRPSNSAPSNLPLISPCGVPLKASNQQKAVQASTQISSESSIEDLAKHFNVDPNLLKATLQALAGNPTSEVSTTPKQIKTPATYATVEEDEEIEIDQVGNQDTLFNNALKATIDNAHSRGVEVVDRRCDSSTASSSLKKLSI